MTDPDLIKKKLAQIETYLRELTTLASIDALGSDLREERFIEHTLQLAIQAALDVASHIVSDERLGEPRTNRELFDLLARAGWLDDELAETLRRMVGFRNVLVHVPQAFTPQIAARGLLDSSSPALSQEARTR